MNIFGTAAIPLNLHLSATGNAPGSPQTGSQRGLSALLSRLSFCRIMVEPNGLDIMCLSKYCHSSSSSSSSENDKEIFGQQKCNLPRDYPRKNAEIISGQYGTNVLLIGAALMLAIANHGPTVTEEHLLSFLTCLIIIQQFWMLWYIVVRHRRKDARTERDVHATTCWIRGVLVRFSNKKRIISGLKRDSAVLKRVLFFISFRGVDSPGAPLSHHGRFPNRILCWLPLLCVGGARGISGRPCNSHCGAGKLTTQLLFQ